MDGLFSIVAYHQISMNSVKASAPSQAFCGYKQFRYDIIHPFYFAPDWKLEAGWIVRLWNYDLFPYLF